jgi:hypothetical protein
MISSKIIFTIISFYLCIQISELKYFQIPDSYWEKQKCNAIENGYEYENIVVDKEGIKNGDPSIDCWYTCNYGEKCLLKLEQPTIYNFFVRIISGMIMSINFYYVFNC